ncbi:two-component system NtrC family sensor kinase [Azospirillum baldaniorum]|nr:two-component system NtrC family sensor kinase [Azospirillum baldaniorum]
MGGVTPQSQGARPNPPRPNMLKRLAAAYAESVRLKLLALVLAPLLVGAPVLLMIVWAWGTQGYDQLLVNKVSSDLGTARQFFDRVQMSLRNGLEGVATSHRLALVLERGTPADLRRLLEEEAEEHGLDYLLLLDAGGMVRAGGSFAVPADRSGWSVVREALHGYAQHGLEVFAPAELEALNPALRRAAHTPLVPTRAARPDPRNVENHGAEDRGLVIQVAIPFDGPDGRLLGVLEGGVLLNGNQGIVDRLNTIVYQDASLPLGSQGTATLFLGDTRIATNVRLFEGQRALGTRASQAVADKVLDRGEPWLGSAFVVNDTYVSGYQPLADTAGRRIGMLYVGFLESPLRDTLYKALAGLFLLFLLVSGLGTLVGLRGARAIFRPLERMAGVIVRIERGEDSARIGPTASRDELGRLARAFDHLLDSVAARRWELQRSAEELDRKVALRTAALEEANATLRRAQQQLVMNEKLTAIGELTAGVAHEINNPVAVIQGNLDLLREVLGDGIEPVRQEVRLIDEQTRRIHAIVTKLLQFARPGDFAGYAEPTDVNGVLSDCLVLTRHNLNRARVVVTLETRAGGPVEMNRGELQQVLINLIVNAMQAMPEGGRLTLDSRDIGPDERLPGAEPFEGVLVGVEDTGHGIAAGDLARIFDPFFTTKKQTGTGLGLSISYAIVQRYGGRITVESVPGRGTRFTLWLRRQAVYSDQPTAPFFAAQRITAGG